MAKRYMTTKRLNFMCANGLYAISAKARAGSPLLSVFLTDFAASVRVVVDMAEKKVLANKYDIKLEVSDIERIAGVFEAKEVSTAEKKIADANKAVEKLKSVDVVSVVEIVDDGMPF